MQIDLCKFDPYQAILQAMKRTKEQGPYSYHAEGCKLRYDKPALYCEACNGGSSQLSFFISKEVEAEARVEETKEAEVKNEFPERNIPIKNCICGLPYNDITWETEINVLAICTTCGDRSRQKCSKEYVKRGYKWR